MNTDDFFIPENSVTGITEQDYEKIPEIIRDANVYAKATNNSIYIIDYYRKGFVYVSPNPLFLCGHTAEEVQKMGYRFYMENVPSKDLEFLIRINREGFRFFCTFPQEERHECMISYDFHIQGEKKIILINHKLVPLRLAADGKIWLAMCIVSLSGRKETGNITFRNKDKRWVYQYGIKQWKKEAIKLTDTELEIIRMAAQGYKVEEIASITHKSVNTIKKHRKKILQKLEAVNITESLFIAINDKLM